MGVRLHLLRAAACAAVLALLAGCHGSHNQNSTDLRALNAVVGSEPLDVLVADNVKASAVPVGSVSSYAEFASGTQDVKVRSSTTQTVLSEKSLGIGSGANFTLALFGKRSSILTLLLTDDTTDPSSGKFKMRVADLSPDAPAIDLYVTAADIGTTTPIFSNSTFGTPTDYLEISPGTFNFVVTTAGTKDVLFSSTSQVIAANAKLTFVVFPSSGGKLVNGMLLSSTGGTFMANASARLKAVNAIPDAGPLNFKADGALLLASVPFIGTSSYVPTAAGTHNLQIEAVNVPGVNIASVSRQLTGAADYTLMGTDSLANPQAVVLVDDNTLPLSGDAKVRFVNALPGTLSADVLVNFASQATGIAYRGASAYAQLPGGTSFTYNVTFTSPGGVTTLATLPAAEFDAGGVFSVYLLGPANSPQVKISRDR